MAAAVVTALLVACGTDDEQLPSAVQATPPGTGTGEPDGPDELDDLDAPEDGDAGEGPDGSTGTEAPDGAIPSETGGAAADMPAELDAPVATIVAHLSDPATATDGAWMLARRLGLGVYRPDGRQLLAGSETREDDLWLYDFAIPAIAHMASLPAYPFTEFHAALAADGLEVTADELLGLFAVLTEWEPDAAISQILDAFGVDLGADADELSITPLTGWLMLLALTPGGGDGGTSSTVGFAPRTAPRTAPVRAVADGQAAGDPDCGAISGDGSPSDYSVGDKLSEQADSTIQDEAIERLERRLGSRGRDVYRTARRWLGRAAKVLEAVTIGTALAGVETSLSAEPGSVRRLQDDEPDGSQAAEIVASVVSTQEGTIECGPLEGVELPSAGPLENAGVELSIDGALNVHGHLRRTGRPTQRQLTGPDGTVEARYETVRDDPPDAYRDGTLEHDTGHVVARFDVLGALGEAFNLFASVEIVTRGLGLHRETLPIEVSWYSTGWQLQIHWNPGGAGGENVAVLLWDGSFSIDDDGVVSGSGIGSISGECFHPPAAYSGTWDFIVTGEQIGEQLHLDFPTSNLSTTATDDCGDDANFAIPNFSAFVGVDAFVVPAAAGTYSQPAQFGQPPVEIVLTE